MQRCVSRIEGIALLERERRLLFARGLFFQADRGAAAVAAVEAVGRFAADDAAALGFPLGALALVGEFDGVFTFWAMHGSYLVADYACCAPTNLHEPSQRDP